MLEASTYMRHGKLLTSAIQVASLHMNRQVSRKSYMLS